MEVCLLSKLHLPQHHQLLILLLGRRLLGQGEVGHLQAQPPLKATAPSNVHMELCILSALYKKKKRGGSRRSGFAAELLTEVLARTAWPSWPTWFTPF